MEEQFQVTWENTLEQITGWIDTLVANLPNIFLAIFVFGISYWLATHLPRWLNKPLKRFVKPVSVRSLLASTISILIIALGLFKAHLSSGTNHFY